MNNITYNNNREAFIQEKYGTQCDKRCIYHKVTYCDMLRYSPKIASRFGGKCTMYLKRLVVAKPSLVDIILGD